MRGQVFVEGELSHWRPSMVVVAILRRRARLTTVATQRPAGLLYFQPVILRGPSTFVGSRGTPSILLIFL